VASNQGLKIIGRLLMPRTTFNAELAERVRRVLR